MEIRQFFRAEGQAGKGTKMNHLLALVVSGRRRPRRTHHLVVLRVAMASAAIGALVGSLAFAEEPCEPGEGGYPQECPGIARIIVCDYGRVVDDLEYQFEPFIAAIQRECEITLAGVWIDQANPNDNLAVNHIAVSLSDDGGETWRPPGGDFALCEFMGDDPRRFLNGCYFSECVGMPLDCELLPDNCGPYLDSPWHGYDPGICAGGNDHLYLIALSDITEPGCEPYTRTDLLFSRSNDFGWSWGPFAWTPQPDRRLKHICDMDSKEPDRSLIAAAPAPGSDFVMVYWNDAGHDHIYALRSLDAGDDWEGFDGGSDPTELCAVLNPLQVYGPHVAINGDSEVCLAWAQYSGTDQGEIHLRRWDEANGWYPDPASDDPPITVVRPFPTCFGHGPYHERSSPSIAVDCTHSIGASSGPGPYNGWIYIVYAERRTSSLPGQPPGNLGRLKFVRSCDGGLTWSNPETISRDAEHPESRQFYPRVRVDGRGNIGVSWYDSRHADSQSVYSKYDIYFAYSSNGGDSWFERRVTQGESGQPFFDTCTAGLPVDYSGMTSDPRSGFSTFYILAMGKPFGADDLDIYSYAVHLRPKGDFDGDHDVDGFDGQFNLCMWPPHPICECAALDLNGDGEVNYDDIVLFPDVLTGALCDCHGPCHEDPECNGEGPGDGAWWDDESLADLPSECDLAKWFVTHVPLECVQGLVEKLAKYVDSHPDDPQAEEMLQFIVCFYAVFK